MYPRNILIHVLCILQQNKIITENDCWLYSKYKGLKSRYVIITYDNVHVRIHVASAIFYLGYRPNEGEYPRKLVMHKCNNKLCWNPKHLKIGTDYENLCQALTDGLLNRYKPKKLLPRSKLY